MTELLAIRVPGGAPPNGHYSQAIVHHGTAYLSMQLPLTCEGKIESDSIEGQADQVIANCARILQATGSSLAHVLSVAVYLTDIGDWQAVDQVFALRFGNHRPARGVMGVSALHLGARIGMQIVAACPEHGASLAR